MPSPYDQGRGLAQNGATATPGQPAYQSQNKIDAGFASVSTAPRPFSQSSTNNKKIE